MLAKKETMLLATIFGASTFTSGVVTAQGQNVLDEIVVTAQKREEKLQDVPISTTVISEEQLDSQHIYSITDLARTTPALEMIQAFGGPGGGGQVRGIGTQSFTPTAEGAVGIVVDGVPQGNLNLSNIFDMARVEVLKGPQGTLFGLTTSAGVINMVTVAPNPEEFSAKIHADFSSKGTAGSGYGQETLRGVVNIPVNDFSALRLSLTSDQIEGVQTNEFTGDENLREDLGIRARYLLKNEAFDINLIADYSTVEQNYGDPAFTYISANPGLTAQLAECGISASYANQARCGDNSNRTENTNTGVSAQFDFYMGDASLTSITAYRNLDSGPSDNDIMGLYNQALQIYDVGTMNDSTQFSQEFRYASPTGNTVEYIAGLFYSDYESEGSSEEDGGFFVELRLPPPPNGPGTIPLASDASDSLTTNKSWAAFGQLTYHLNDQINLLAGLRYTDQEIKTSTSANRYDPASEPTFGAVSETNVSGKIGLQYLINPEMTLYTTYTKGYKGPQVSPAAQGEPATVINPEIPEAFEIGLKGSLLDGAFGYEGNVFHTKVKDYQGQRCQIISIGALACVGETVPSVKTKGFEVALFGQPTAGLYINAGFIYNIAEYPNGWTGYNPENLNGGTTDLSGEQLVGVPEQKLTLSGEYSTEFGSALEGFISVDSVYKSDIRFGPTADSRFVYPDHWTIGMRMGIRSVDGAWTAALFGRNIANEHEPITIFGGPSFTGPGQDPSQPDGYVNGVSGWASANALRQVGLTLDYNF